MIHLETVSYSVDSELINAKSLEDRGHVPYDSV